MHKDIRSFFKVVSKKSGSDSKGTTKAPTRSKYLAVISDSDEDIVEQTPTKTKDNKPSHHKKRPPVVISSDSDNDHKEKPKTKEKSPRKKLKLDAKEPNLKPVNIDELFNNITVKQSKVDYVPPKEPEKSDKNKNEKSSKKEKKKNTELGVHNDEAFERTLIELDEDDDTILLNNMDILDKTMEEAEKQMRIEEMNKKEREMEEHSKNTDHRDTPKKDDKKRHRRDSNESKATPSKKQKLEHVDSGIDNGEAKWEKKRYSAVLYQKYLQRGGPKHHGQKELPEGKPDCLQNLTFLRTGVLDSLESEEFDNLIKSHGGRTVHAVSRKVNYLVVGDDPGPAKLEKARNYSIKEINENQLLDMILVKSGMEPKYAIHSDDQGIGSRENSPEHTKSLKVKSSKVKRGSELIKNRENSDPTNDDDKKSPEKRDKIDRVNHKTEKEFKNDKLSRDRNDHVEVKMETKKEKHVHAKINSSKDIEEKHEIHKKEHKTESSSKMPDVESQKLVKPGHVERKTSPLVSQKVVKNEKASPDNQKETFVKIDKKIESDSQVKKASSFGSQKIVETGVKKEKTSSHDQKETISMLKKEKTEANQAKTEKKNEKTTVSGSQVKSEKIEANKETTEDGNQVKSGNIQDATQIQCWTEKYRPTSMKSVIGQQESNSNMNKLKRWLEKWEHNQKPEVKKRLPRPSPWDQMDGAYYKAALLSGPPAVGKTTTATLVAKELGYDVVEFNASDTRSKKLLHLEISQMMNQTSVSGFALGRKNAKPKRILLMDEVDGMAGNEDRGGIAELINLIKITDFPIVCMCNDRGHQKMRTLLTHCYELKFSKPKLNQIRGAMMSICFKEGLKIKPDALADIISGSGFDMRQILNNLAMWSAVNKNLTDSNVKNEAAKAQKDVVLGPWDVARKVFNYHDNHAMSVIDKSKLFFYDYSLGPLFVQENYLKNRPRMPSRKTHKEIVKETLRRMCLSAESLAMGDQIESKIRSTNNWALLDSQAYFSLVIPSYYMSGETKSFDFPSWFGKNSKLNKTKRLMSEVHAHTRTSTSGDKTSIRLDYCIPLRNAIVQPLKTLGTEGVRKALDVMKSYSLLREDLTNLVELCQGFKNKDTFQAVDAKVKAAFTRAYNKEVLLPFAPPAASKKKKTADDDEGQFLGEENEDQDDDDQQDDSVEKDGLIKVKTAKGVKNTSPKAGSSKTSAKGKGKK